MITTIDSIFRLCVALLLGGIIGYERQAQSKSAGLRTHILVCLGSCLCMIVSINIAMDNYFAYGLTNSDPERIAAQVITGVGFLGAGTILANQKERNVRGLTTAASIWAVAAVGLVVGAGYIATATAATVMVFIVLTLFVRLDKRLRLRKKRQATFIVVMNNTVGQSRRLGDLFKKKDLLIDSFQSLSAEDEQSIEIEFTVSAYKPIDENAIVSSLLSLGGVTDARIGLEEEKKNHVDENKA